jgi:hypothetical protein
MTLGHADRGLRRIHPDYRGAELSERFAQYAASTPNNDADRLSDPGPTNMLDAVL